MFQSKCCCSFCQVRTWKFSFSPSPLCPIFAFLLFMKFRLHFWCDWYYISCFCLQIGWPSMSSSPLQQRGDGRSHFLPSRKDVSPTKEMDWLKQIKTGEQPTCSGLTALALYHIVENTTEVWEKWVPTQLEAPSQQDFVLWSVLDESHFPSPHGHFGWCWGVNMPSCIPLTWRRTVLWHVSLPLKDLKFLLSCSFLWNLRTWSH